VRALATAGALALATTLGGCGGVSSRLPRFGATLLPPVTPWVTDTVALSGRQFHRVDTPQFELYVQSARQLPELQAAVASTAQEFARHFVGAPKVAVLLFDAPADPHRDFDFGPFVARRMQVLALVRQRDAQKAGELGVDDGLLAARVAELFLASYTDSVARTRGTEKLATISASQRAALTAGRALERLPHWFVEATVSRIARPDAVDAGLRFVRANQRRLTPLPALFTMARLRMPTWSELARRGDVVRVYTEPTAHTPPPLLAAESTVFGEFLVSQYGPTFLQAMADELLTGATTEDALAAMPGTPEDRQRLEGEWARWLGQQR
jgi:hypothetical protein